MDETTDPTDAEVKAANGMNYHVFAVYHVYCDGDNLSEDFGSMSEAERAMVDAAKEDTTAEEWAEKVAGATP